MIHANSIPKTILKIVIISVLVLIDLYAAWQFYCFREGKYSKFDTTVVGRDKVAIDFGVSSFSIRYSDVHTENENVRGCFAAGKVVLYSPSRIPVPPSVFEDWQGNSIAMKNYSKYTDSWVKVEGRLNSTLADVWDKVPACNGQGDLTIKVKPDGSLQNWSIHNCNFVDSRGESDEVRAKRRTSFLKNVQFSIDQTFKSHKFPFKNAEAAEFSITLCSDKIRVPRFTSVQGTKDVQTTDGNYNVLDF